MDKGDKVLVLCSGGLDSTTLLAKAVAAVGNKNVIALNMYYGQKHAKEADCAVWQCEHYDVYLVDADLTDVFKFNPDCSALLKGSHLQIVHKSYAEQLKDLGGTGTVSAYVPFRNGLFLSYASAVAMQFHCNVILYGAHADDAAGRAYPDCTPEFITAMQKAIYEGTGQTVSLEAPFWNYNKTQIVAEGVKYKVDYAHTWSCYEGKAEPCGTCGTCIDRKIALEANGIFNVK